MLIDNCTNTRNSDAKNTSFFIDDLYLGIFVHFNANLNLKNFMAPFYGWGSTVSRLEPLRGGSLLFTNKFPEIPGTHFIDLGRMKG